MKDKVNDDVKVEVNASAGEADARAGTPREAPPEPRSSRRRRTLKLALLGVGIFACGCLVGVGVAAASMQRGMSRAMRDPSRLSARIVSHMRGKLDLTDDQAEKARAILTRRHLAIRDAVRGNLDAMHEEICEVLTREQAAVWEEHVAERRARFFGEAGRGEDEGKGDSGAR